MAVTYENRGTLTVSEVNPRSRDAYAAAQICKTQNINSVSRGRRYGGRILTAYATLELVYQERAII